MLRVDVRVLDRPDAYVADRNAASIRRAPDGLTTIERSEAFARDWQHDDEQAQQEARAKVMAEVLILGHVPPDLVAGAHVVDRRRNREAVSP